MKQIIDFYKNLDVLNMIIFWGVIIVVILLLVFAIIISKKNKKLQNVCHCHLALLNICLSAC